MSRLQGFDSWGNARPKRQIGFGDTCAGGQPPLNNGQLWDRKEGKCLGCDRTDLTPWKDGHIPPHSSKNPNKMAELERRARKT